jgi:hypothetical protein
VHKEKRKIDPERASSIKEREEEEGGYLLIAMLEAQREAATT